MKKIIVLCSIINFLHTQEPSLIPSPGSPFSAVGTFTFDLSFAPNGCFLTVTNLFGIDNVVTFAINGANGALTPVNSLTLGLAGGVDYHPQGRIVAASQIIPSQVTTYSVDQTTGALTLLDGPFATGSGGISGFIEFSPDGSLLAVKNTTDISIFLVNANTGTLFTAPGSPVILPGGGNLFSALTFSPDGKFLISSVSTGGIFVFEVNPDGSLTSVSGSPFLGNPSTGLDISPDGKFLAVAETAPAQVVVYSFDSSSGAISPIQTISTQPGAISLDYSPDGRFVAVSDSIGTLTLFQVEQTNGMLSTDPNSPYTTAAGSNPAVLFSPSSFFTGVTNLGGLISMFQVVKIMFENSLSQAIFTKYSPLCCGVTN